MSPDPHERDVPPISAFDPATATLPTALSGGSLEPVVLLLDVADDRQWAADAAIALAGAWARDGRRIVLADLHLEEPILHERVGQENLDGVVDLFLYGASLARSARPVPGRRFYLITAGTFTPDTAAVLRHARWAKLVVGFRDAQASLLLFVRGDSADAASLTQWSGQVIVLGEADRIGRADAVLPPGKAVQAALSPSLPDEPVPAVGELTAVGADDQDANLAPPTDEHDLAGRALPIADAGDIGDAAPAEQPYLGGEPASEEELPAPPPPRPPRETGLEISVVRIPRDAAPVVEPADMADEAEADVPDADDDPFADETEAAWDTAGPQGSAWPAEDATVPFPGAMAPEEGATVPLRVPIVNESEAGDTRWIEPAPAPRMGRRSSRRGRSGRVPVVVWVLVGLALLAGAAYLIAAAGPGTSTTDAAAVPEGAEPDTSAVAAGRAAAAPPAAVASGIAVPYAVQVKAFATLGNARDQVMAEQRRFADAPFYISPERIQGILYYKVLAGLPADSAAATQLRQRLVDAGAIDPEDAAGSWSLIQYAPLAFLLGEFENPDAATSRADSMFARGVPVYSVRVPYSDGSERWRLYGGAFRDSTRAEGMRELLAAAGVDAPLQERIGSPADLAQ